MIGALRRVRPERLTVVRAGNDLGGCCCAGGSSWRRLPSPVGEQRQALAFLRGSGKGLVVETVRYWASRIALADGGRAHLLGVMGPDEYHEVINENGLEAATCAPSNRGSATSV